MQAIAVVLFGLAISFGGFELLFRLLGVGSSAHWYDRPQFYYNPPASRSLRGMTHDAKKPDGAFRIAVVGDSYSFGPFLQFDDTFARRLERMLNLNEGGRVVEVPNYGIPALSTSHEIKEIERALGDKPDLILLQITLNDPEVKYYAPTGIQVKRNPMGALVVEERAGWLSRHSRLAAFIAGRLHNSASHREYIDYFHRLYVDPVGMARYRKSLSRIVELCEKRKVRLAAIVFPLFGTRVDENYPFRDLHEIIHKELESRGVPFLDLTESFRGIPPERLQVMPGEDFHPNEIGHRIAAESIYRWLVHGGLVPGELGKTSFYRERDQIELKEELKIPLP